MTTLASGLPDVATLYTRGGPGEERRGESMVQKHIEKMQQEKENACMEKVSALMPQLGKAVCALALQEAEWDVEKALQLLRQFYSANNEQLVAIGKRRRKLQEAAEVKGSEPGQEKGSTGSEFGTDSDSDDTGKKRKHSSKHKKRKSKSKKHSKESSKAKRNKSDAEHEEVARDENKRRKLTHSEDFGRIGGIIRESDFYAKRSEFTAWALDIKRIDVEVMPKNEERELYKEFMEDYNTGTLPHKKYYDLESYERYKAAKAAAKGLKNAARDGTGERAAFNDEEQLKHERAAERARQQAERMADAYKELKYSTKAQDMREQELLRMQAALAYKTGDTAKAQKLMELLKPEEQKKVDADRRMVEQSQQQQQP